MSSFGRQVLAVALGGLIAAGIVVGWMKHKEGLAERARQDALMASIGQGCGKAKSQIDTADLTALVDCVKAYKKVEADPELGRLHADAAARRAEIEGKIGAFCEEVMGGRETMKLHACGLAYQSLGEEARAGDIFATEKAVGDAERAERRQRLADEAAERRRKWEEQRSALELERKPKPPTQEAIERCKRAVQVGCLDARRRGTVEFITRQCDMDRRYKECETRGSSGF
ncbi:MAG TPA: hypothetical protein VED18_01795 [Candidatus Sulfotelmatobacter sp.]|nr:hypothetical protein [Candidatus Sulfotelmatobacter sp.]